MTLLNERGLHRLQSALSSIDDRFDQLVRIAGLDPYRDLRYADLRNVDFEGSHLVGWDLTGADLRGASFRGARVRNCIFTNAIGVDMSGAIRAHPSEVQFALPDFHYQDGVLHIESVDIRTIADKVSTPFYCYSTASLVRRFEEYRRAFAQTDTLICYALKANSNQAVIATLAQCGAGASVVSEGELRRARVAGIPAEKIVFSGPGKSERDLALAIDEGILCINVESKPELERLASIASVKDRTANVSLRLAPSTTSFSAGEYERKFALSQSLARELCAYASTLASVRIVGVSTHIGSQIDQLELFEGAFAEIVEFVKVLRADGHNLTQINLGGGLAIPYDDLSRHSRPSPDCLAELADGVMLDIGCRLIVEPGRYLVGNSGALVTNVLYVKRGVAKTFVIVDAGMNDLMRPSLYDAYHEVCAVVLPNESLQPITADVVGPVCESGDFLALSRELAEPKSGDLLAVMSAGGYGAVQSTNYNTRATIAEVLVMGSEFAIIRPRVETEEIISRDQIPDWLMLK